jgi:hypothetical protein
MEKYTEIKRTFELLGHSFDMETFKNIYFIYSTDPGWAEEQVRSIADTWHNGSVLAAAIAFESDLNHS